MDSTWTIREYLKDQRVHGLKWNEKSLRDDLRKFFWEEERYKVELHNIWEQFSILSIHQVWWTSELWLCCYCCLTSWPFLLDHCCLTLQCWQSNLWHKLCKIIFFSPPPAWGEGGGVKVVSLWLGWTGGLIKDDYCTRMNWSYNKLLNIKHERISAV